MPSKRSGTRLLQFLLLLIGIVTVRITTFHPECSTQDKTSDFVAPPNKLITRTASTSHPTSNTTTADTPTSVCNYFEQTSALALWTQHLERIFQASRLPKDKRFKLHDKTAHLLQLVTPRLPYAQKSWTRQDAAVSRILDKLQQHLEYAQDHRKRAKQPEPVHVVVLGGSVTAGINCYTGVGGSDIANCAWSARLDSLLNHALPSAFQVHNWAVSGSNTAIATAMYKFEMYDPTIQPDIVIHAYSTNDMHIQTIQQAAANNISLSEQILSMSQDFVRTVMSCPGNAPLLIWLDDYLGNEQRRVLATMQHVQALSLLTNYYGISWASYADAVRDWVYGDTHEGVFSPGKWYASPHAQKMQREIHPSQPMHMATAWMLAFHLLELASQHCTLQAAWGTDSTAWPRETSFQQGIQGLPALRDPTQDPWPKRPKSLPDGLPPPLNTKLRLDQISAQWQEQAQNSVSECNKRTGRRCPFSWLSGTQQLDSAKGNALFAPYLQDKSDWEFVDDTGRGDKWGWMPKGNNSSLILEFNATGIQTIGLFFLKSYGPKWEDSTVTVTVQELSSPKQYKTLAGPVKLTGFHNKKTSELYSHEIVLPAATQNNVRIPIQLVCGNTFKLMGLAICR